MLPSIVKYGIKKTGEWNALEFNSNAANLLTQFLLPQGWSDDPERR